ncbi:MAG: Tryptophan synthase alpha chain [Chlamydiia bacterium]|nr:Tryptophan synthase alpha chain [Chlamydiia bacterium]MCH9615733.1 Tryptophan synthase alpha chain [Chlamydiia bacterium]MCH9628864.1 Tryptophan synthase alpha chain [Chlamydiia bacterium]
MKYVGFLTADTNTVEMAKALIAGGVDVLELGIPFSDPVADGPVIQEATTRALENGMTPKKVLEIVRELRKTTDIDIILFTYFNPILNAGEKYLLEAKQAGVTGILIVDLPLEHIESIKAHDLKVIQIVSASTPEKRIEEIAKHSSGFIYYACRKGTTGMKNDLPEDLEPRVKLIKSHTDLPVAVGFGISNREMASKVLKCADAFVIGSLFVKAILDGKTPDELKELAQSVNPGK